MRLTKEICANLIRKINQKLRFQCTDLHFIFIVSFFNYYTYYHHSPYHIQCIDLVNAELKPNERKENEEMKRWKNIMENLANVCSFNWWLFRKMNSWTVNSHKKICICIGRGSFSLYENPLRRLCHFIIASFSWKSMNIISTERRTDEDEIRSTIWLLLRSLFIFYEMHHIKGIFLA